LNDGFLRLGKFYRRVLTHCGKQKGTVKNLLVFAPKSLKEQTQGLPWLAAAKANAGQVLHQNINRSRNWKPGLESF
jgi:hypothetical protein